MRGSNKHMLARLYSLAQAAVFILMVLYLLSIITCQAIVQHPIPKLPLTLSQ
jgi:hypothetical protein